MFKTMKILIVLGSLIIQSCSQIGVIKTDYLNSDERYFASKEYKIKNNILHNSSFVIKNVVFNSILPKPYVPSDTIKFYNDKSNFIFIKCDDNGMLVAIDQDDSYKIYIKIDSLLEREYMLNDDNVVIRRNLNMAQFALEDIKGSLLIKSLSEETMCCSIDIQINEILQNNNHFPITGRMIGDFCLPVKNN